MKILRSGFMAKEENYGLREVLNGTFETDGR